jgi:hypothetical protein
LSGLLVRLVETLPVATRARPSVQWMRSPGTASARSYGLDRGKIIGLPTLPAISLTIGAGITAIHRK